VLVSAQLVVNILDLIGILGIAALTASSMSSPNVGTKGISTIQDFINYEFNEANLTLIILLCFSVKTILSILVTRQILGITTKEFEQTSSLLIKQLLTKKQATNEKTSKQQSIYTCTRGVEFMYLQVLVPGLNILTDLGLIALLLFGALVVNPLVSVLLISTLFFLAVILNLKLNRKIQALGGRYTSLTIESDEDIHDALSVKRELALFGIQGVFLGEIMEKREELGKVVAKTAFIPFVSKYLVEGGVVVSFALLTLISLFFENKTEFFVVLAVFAAVGTRITPAVLRIQHGFLQMKSNYELASLTLLAIQETNIQLAENSPDLEIQTDAQFGDLVPEILLEDISFHYSEENQLLRNFSATFAPKEIIAIVGASGVGKSTLVDLMLGFLDPISGEIRIDRNTPSQALRRSPGLVSLVPQEIHILSRSLIENIALGVTPEGIDIARAELLINECELTELVNSLPSGLWTLIGEKGIQLSGGQKQRIGIARALYRDPKILFLDESTSALDSVTESLINQKLFQGAHERTTIVIAHRLSTVMNANTVVFLGSEGHFDVGSFEEIRERNIEFDQQAAMLGL
jgi:ABC-type multidrug transport system fused ATPase/permease subunit